MTTTQLTQIKKLLAERLLNNDMLIWNLLQWFLLTIQKLKLTLASKIYVSIHPYMYIIVNIFVQNLQKTTPQICGVAFDSPLIAVG